MVEYVYWVSVTECIDADMYVTWLSQLFSKGSEAHK